MSNEISLNLKLSLSNLAVGDDGPGLGTQRLNQTGGALLWKRVIALVAGTDTDIHALIAGITTPGLCYLINQDPTNYVQWGPDNGSGALAVLGQIGPSQVVDGQTIYDATPFFRFDPTGTLRAKAHTGNCNLLVCVYQN